ncbi:hypothetical protein ACFL35_04430 [Candidatus Riflebacteria bacterium]
MPLLPKMPFFLKFVASEVIVVGSHEVVSSRKLAAGFFKGVRTPGEIGC